jgi:hypothetical protein
VADAAAGRAAHGAADLFDSNIDPEPAYNAMLTTSGGVSSTQTGHFLAQGASRSNPRPTIHRFGLDHRSGDDDD